MSPERRASYLPRLGLFDATMAVVGGIIGAGIFLNPAIVAARVGSAALTMAAWVLGGLIAIAGAFCFGELGARRPRAGGGYVYLREAFGGLPAFLYGWTLLLVIGTGAVAAVAATFASYASDLAGLTAEAAVPLAAAAILALSSVNYVGVRQGSLTQNVFTVLKFAALTALILTGLLGPRGAAPVSAAPVRVPVGSFEVFVTMGAALVPVLFAYGGWQQTNFIAEEIREPQRQLPRALALGVGIVVTVYLLSNGAYLRTLSVAGLAASRAPASDVMRSVLGPLGRTLIAAGIVASTFGFLNLVILVSPRVYQSMADDGLFFRAAARLHPRYRTPAAAIVFQAAWAIALLLTGSYAQLLDYVVFGDWIFFGLTASALFVLRRRDGAARPAFVDPLYPWGPGLFVLASVYVVASSVAANPLNALLGAFLIGLGVPVYFFWRGRPG